MTHPALTRIADWQPVRPYGRVKALGSGVIEATGPAAGLGTLVEIVTEGTPIWAEVVAVSDQGITAVALDRAADVRMGARVQLSFGGRYPTGDAFAGRAVNALGQAIDGGSIIPAAETSERKPATALERISPPAALTTGIRAIDGLLTLGIGQRIGIFAASGVGKTTLVEQLAAQVECDRAVICLIGERGREVTGFWEKFSVGDAGRRAALIAATSDESPAMRARAVDQALAMAMHWRARGEHVLFVLDSATRLAMALRELGLASGAPPTVRAYTPNVFSILPSVVERCGALRSGGAITAFMTVLTETDSADDPIAELMKSLLDGHIVLGRELAERGHFPAIDVVRSISRQASLLIEPEHASLRRQAIALLADYDENRIMIESGVYKSGASARIDRAIAARERLGQFLQQGEAVSELFPATIDALARSLEAAHGRS